MTSAYAHRGVYYSMLCSHNICHYLSGFTLCSVVEAFKINEAFVLNQEAIMNIGTLIISYMDFFLLVDFLLVRLFTQECLLCKREKTCDFLVYKLFPNKNPPHKSSAVRIIDILKCVVLFGLSKIIILLAFGNQSLSLKMFKIICWLRK